jgi:hypothetical protein
MEVSRERILNNDAGVRKLGEDASVRLKCCAASIPAASI